MGENDYIKMFDLNYLTIVRVVRKNADRLNDYSQLKDKIKDRNDYINIYNDLMQKYNITITIYTAIRMYNMLCDAYFQDYTESICDKKLKYFKKNGLYSSPFHSSLDYVA